MMNFKKTMCALISIFMLFMFAGCSGNKKGFSVSEEPTVTQPENGITMYSHGGKTKVVDESEAESLKSEGWMEIYEFYLTKNFKDIYDYHGNLNFMYGYEGGYYFAAPDDQAVHFGFTIGDFYDNKGNFMDINQMENHNGTPMPAEPDNSKCVSLYGTVSRILPALGKYVHEDGMIYKDDLEKYFGEINFQPDLDNEYSILTSKASPFLTEDAAFLFVTDENGNVKFEQGVVSVGFYTPATDEGEDKKTNPGKQESQNDKPAQNAAPDYKSAYKEVLLNALKSIDYPEYAFFSLIYIDDDSIPELVYNDSTSHASGAHLFTFHNGRAMAVNITNTYDGAASNVYGSYGALTYLPRTGRFASSYMGMGVSTISVYTLENGKAELQCEFYDSTGQMGGNGNLTINSEDVDRDTYVEKMSSYGFTDEYGSGYEAAPPFEEGADRHNLNEAEIVAVLG